MNFSKFRHITDRRVIERELAAIAQLQNGDGRHGLGDGSPVVACVRVDGRMGVFARFSKRKLSCRLTGMDEGDSSTDNAMLRKNGFEVFAKRIELGETSDGKQ